MLNAATGSEALTITKSVHLLGKGIRSTKLTGGITVTSGATGLTLDGLTISFTSDPTVPEPDTVAIVCVSPTLYYEFVYDLTINNCAFEASD